MCINIYSLEVDTILLHFSYIVDYVDGVWTAQPADLNVKQKQHYLHEISITTSQLMLHCWTNWTTVV